jgi:hypothetical protein
MNASAYGRYIITELKEGGVRPSSGVSDVPGGDCRTERVLGVDDDTVPGAFFSEYLWHFPDLMGGSGQTGRPGPVSHTHSFEEVIGFVGTNSDDLSDLGGEIELWLEDERFLLTRSFLVHIPAGMRHCPYRINRMERPILQYVLGSAPKYDGAEANKETGHSDTDLKERFVFEYKKNLVHPEYRGRAPDEPGRHVHITYLDAEVVPGASFYVEASWFGLGLRPIPEPGKEPPGPKPHVHPFPEIVTFFGTNPEDVHDLGGAVELWIGGEGHVVTNSCVAYIPGGVVHCPMFLRRLDRPIFHFTAGPGKMYV